MPIKTTALPPLTVPASDDVFPIVDISAGSTKKITRENFLKGAPLPADTVDTQAVEDKSVTSEKLSPTVGFYATSTANINATQSLVTVYTEVADYGSDFASGVFTAPVTGLYNINIMGLIDNVTADNRFVLFLYKNTSTYIIQSMGLGVVGNHDPTATIALNIPLAADDTLGVQAYSESGTKALNPLIFSGYLVGKV